MRQGDLWGVLFVLGLILFDWPFLSTLRHGSPYSIFLAWAAFIAALWLLGALGSRDRNR